MVWITQTLSHGALKTGPSGCHLVATGGWAVREMHVAGFEDGGRKPPDREGGMPLVTGKGQETGSPWSLQKAQTSHISAQ